MRIAIDGMGGDNAPQAVINGVIQALNEYNDLEFYITGPEDIIKEQLTKEGYTGNKIIVVDAKEVISTNEHPVMAIRKKKDSSLCKALNLVKDKTCDAVLSAGSTGAFLAGCNFIVGRIKGVKRPALTPIMPGKNGPFIVVDAGANVDCKPEYLLQFAHMGKEYYKGVLNSENPSIGLVNIGAEEEKGNDLTKNTYQLLKNEKMLETTEKVVYSCLDLFPRNVSEIQMKTGLDARILMETLMTLEMEGYIKETAKNYYVRMSDVR